MRSWPSAPLHCTRLQFTTRACYFLNTISELKTAKTSRYQLLLRARSSSPVPWSPGFPSEGYNPKANVFCNPPKPYSTQQPQPHPCKTLLVRYYSEQSSGSFSRGEAAPPKTESGAFTCSNPNSESWLFSKHLPHMLHPHLSLLVPPQKIWQKLSSQPRHSSGTGEGGPGHGACCHDQHSSCLHRAPSNATRQGEGSPSVPIHAWHPHKWHCRPNHHIPHALQHH